MLSEKQNMIRAFPYTNYDALICDGAIRSGKTSIMTVAFVDWAMNNFDGCNFGLCGKTFSTCNRNIVLPYMSLRYAQKRYNMNFRRTDNLLIINKGKVTNHFYLYGGRDAASYQLIQGITMAGIFFDEVALMPKSFVDQGCARCSVEGSRYWFNCNPDKPDHWFYQEWILGHEEKNALYLHFLLEDNPSLSEHIIARYKSMYSGVFYQRYILGMWVRAEGVIFTQFANNPKNWILDKIPKGIRYLTFGIDFGVNHSNTVFICCGIMDKGQGVVVLEEYMRDCTGVAPDGIETDFVDFAKKCIKKYQWIYKDKEIKPTYCWTDQPETLTHGIYAAIKRAGVPIGVTIAKKEAINTRIYAKQRMLNQDKWHVMKWCDMVIFSTQNQVWDDSHPNKDVRLDNEPKVNDVADAEEYAWEAFIDQMGVRGVA